MRIAICDDEVSMVQILEEKIKKLLPDAVIEKYLSGEKLIASGSKPDVRSEEHTSELQSRE